MSSQRKITVTCPKCNKSHPFTIWQSINTSLDPEMKAAVIDLSAFLFECPTCGEKNYVNYSFLYHQMVDKIMIHYASSDKDAEEVCKMLAGDAPAGMLQDMRKNNYLTRLVRTHNELREKIMIFDNGLDDRIIELLKADIFNTFIKDNPDSKDVEILYFRGDEKNYIQILADGKSQGIEELSDELYEELAQEYTDKLPNIRKDGPCIDREWALGTINSN